MKHRSYTEEGLFAKKLSPEKGNLIVGTREFVVSEIADSYSIFNFEIYVVKNIASYVENSLLIEEGIYSEDQKCLLNELSKVTAFNFQQYEIEHAPSTNNIMVAAGAGTGKTYSMVSRVAYLCNRTADAVVDIVSDIAMITFTKDAAENMNSRLKRMFMNYFVLTSNEKYMHLIEDMSQIQISTIHKFAISLLHKECMRMGIGFDSQISSETFDRRQLYHTKLDAYLSEKAEENPDFVHQLTIPSFELESMLINFCDQLYNRSIDIKSVDVSLLGKWYTDENIDRMLMERHLNKKARRGSAKNHIKGRTMSGGHRLCADRSGSGDPRKRTNEDDERFAQSFEKLVLMAQAKEGEQNGTV